MDQEECGVRDKYAKRFEQEVEDDENHFQLYTTFSKPGLLSIFYNEEQRSFHNWRLEVGSGRKQGRIREAIDHQINAPVLEIAGNHDGSVYMVCPPDPNSFINVEMPYVTMLMKDMHGYSSVEFTVLDNLGFSRKICAKNFKSRCTIGELNCEIPMRLSPTWNYACVNLDATLKSAFGSKLVSVQRIKINANARVRRVYFSEEAYGYKFLPQEYRIKLSLTPLEKQEVNMYDEFLVNEFNDHDKVPPYALPHLYLRPQMSSQSLRHSTELQQQLRRRVKIVELSAEIDPDKYSDVKEAKSHGESNTGMLQGMLTRSIPPSQILLPTLSLVYPDKRDPPEAEAEAIQAEKNSEQLLPGGRRIGGVAERKSRASRTGLVETCLKPGGELEQLVKMKKCIDPTDPDEEIKTDWETITASLHSRSNHHHQSHHHHHVPHHHESSCQFNPTELARYIKYREVMGDYDMFSATLRNPNFLEPHISEEEEESMEGDDESESVDNDDELNELMAAAALGGKVETNPPVTTPVNPEDLKGENDGITEIVPVAEHWTDNFNAQAESSQDKDGKRMSEAVEPKKKSSVEPKNKSIVDLKKKSVGEQERKSVVEQERKSVEEPKKSVVEQERKSIVEPKKSLVEEQERKSSVVEPRLPPLHYYNPKLLSRFRMRRHFKWL